MSPPLARGGDPPDRGSVTVEAALAMCALVVVFAVLLTGFLAVLGQLRCTDAANEAARLVARGEGNLADAAVAHTAPAGAQLTVHNGLRSVDVEVTAPPIGGLLPGVELRATAHAVLEPGVADTDPTDPPPPPPAGDPEPPDPFVGAFAVTPTNPEIARTEPPDSVDLSEATDAHP